MSTSDDDDEDDGDDVEINDPVVFMRLLVL
jgi:hypothetical protein